MIKRSHQRTLFSFFRLTLSEFGEKGSVLLGQETAIKERFQKMIGDLAHVDSLYFETQEFPIPEKPQLYMVWACAEVSNGDRRFKLKVGWGVWT